MSEHGLIWGSHGARPLPYTASVAYFVPVTTAVSVISHALCQWGGDRPRGTTEHHALDSSLGTLRLRHSSLGGIIPNTPTPQ